jgi:hypothetical protein
MHPAPQFEQTMMQELREEGTGLEIVSSFKKSL